MTRKRPSLPTIAAIVVAHVGITTLTWRDLRNRPDRLVRGSKKAWRAATAANTTNSLLYLLFGRRRARRAGKLHIVRSGEVHRRIAG